MSIQNRLKDLKDQKSYSIPAKRVMEHLKPILSKSNDLRQRWMWELLQNASDLGDDVKAKFEITNDKLNFSHNGKPFSLGEAYNLIMPDSNKDDELSNRKSVIGQFGTGFISTHILSKVIQVTGVVEDNEQFYSFDFNLNRSERNDKEFLIESIKESEKEYRESLKHIENLPDNEFQTIFTYHIDNTFSSLSGQDIVNDGLESFKLLLPFVLTFRPQLSEIEIVDNRSQRNNWKFQREEIECGIKDLIIIKTVCFQNEKHLKDVLIGNIIDGETEIAFPIENIEANQFRFLPLPENCPKLFCAFPMIGTSNFNFPTIIHSEKFVPNGERDGIEITQYDTENRKRLIEAKDAFLFLLQIAETNEWNDAYNISNFSNPIITDVETKKWFNKELFAPVKDGIYKTKFVELDENLELDIYRKALNEMYIPYSDKRIKDKTEITKQIFAFAFKIIPSQIPNHHQYLNWYETIDFEIFESEKLDLKKLCELVTLKNGTLNDYTKTFNLKKNDVIEFFINLVEFIISQESESLLNEYNLLLNQTNQFVKLKVLKLDFIYHKNLADDYDEKLKNIYLAISNTDCRDNLLHKEFEKIDNLIEKDDKIDFEELAKNTDEKLRNYDGNFQDEDFLLILKDIFHWYTTCGLSEDTLFKLFPYFSSNKSQLYLNTKTHQELEFAFDIEISGKSEVLARLANSNLTESELDIIATNPKLVSSFINWLNSKQEDNPDEELGDIGEEFLYHQLCQLFGENRVLWEDKSEYDFRILENDLATTKYFIDAKTTGKGIANSDNVPFFMRSAQWTFLDKQQASEKYIIARIFKNGTSIEVKYLKLDKQSL